MIRVYHLQPAPSSAAGAQPAASAQPVTPKQSRLAFSGSELSVTLRPQGKRHLHAQLMTLNNDCAATSSWHQAASALWLRRSLRVYAA